jgi:uncharacterized membrane protein YkvA (DUF1232 family)
LSIEIDCVSQYLENGEIISSSSRKKEKKKKRKKGRKKERMERQIYIERDACTARYAGNSKKMLIKDKLKIIFSKIALNLQ